MICIYIYIYIEYIHTRVSVYVLKTEGLECRTGVESCDLASLPPHGMVEEGGKRYGFFSAFLVSGSEAV